MNKNLKKMAILGVTIMMTASNIGISNAMQVKTCNLKSTSKVEICINGKKIKLDLNSKSLFETLKWFNKNYTNKIPSINENDEENKNNSDENNNFENNKNDKGDVLEEDKNNSNTGNNQNNENLESDNQNNSQDNNQNQDKEDENKGDNNQNENKEDTNNNLESKNTFSEEQVEVLNLVNKERKANGLKELTLSKELSDVANIKSKDMIQNGYFDHTSPTYGSPFDMMKKFGISYNTAGENIAMGQKSPAEVMNSWMNSSGHRANILNSSYTQLGVGIQKDSNGTIYWTQMFVGK